MTNGPSENLQRRGEESLAGKSFFSKEKRAEERENGETRTERLQATPPSQAAGLPRTAAQLTQLVS